MIVSGEPVQERDAGRAAGPEAVRQDRRRRPAGRGASPSPTEVADARPAAAGARPEGRRTRTPTPTSSSRATRSRRMAKNFPAPLQVRGRGRGRGQAASSTTAWRYERELFMALMLTPESQGAAPRLLRPSARPARSPTCPTDTPQRKIEKVAVIGAGTMGGGIAMNFLNAGIPVTMLEMKQEALDRGVATIRKNYEAQVKKGKLKQDKYEQRMALLIDHAGLRRHRATPTSSSRRCSRRWASRRRCSRQLDEVMKPGAILATNTSHAGRRQDRRLHQAPAGRGRHCTSSARPT